MSILLMMMMLLSSLLLLIGSIEWDNWTEYGRRQLFLHRILGDADHFAGCSGNCRQVSRLQCHRCAVGMAKVCNTHWFELLRKGESKVNEYYFVCLRCSLFFLVSIEDLASWTFLSFCVHMFSVYSCMFHSFTRKFRIEFQNKEREGEREREREREWEICLWQLVSNIKKWL